MIYRPSKDTHTIKRNGKSMTGGEWQFCVEDFFLETFNWTKVKYGKLNDKLYASLPGGGRKLNWRIVYNQFSQYCDKYEVKVCELSTFAKYVRLRYNIGFKTPRFDQCNDCALIEKWIEETDDEEEKKKLQHYLKCHKHDAELCQDFMFWMYQKSYAQQGKDHQEWETLELHQEYIE